MSLLIGVSFGLHDLSFRTGSQGAGGIAHMDSIGADMHILSLTPPDVQMFDAAGAEACGGLA
jgi:hypothetical protein